VDINAHGVVVCTANGADGKTRAFIWENGVMRDLDVAPGHNTAAVAINDRGQVLGTIDTYTTFLWEDGQTQIISTSRYARALGPNGEVVGGVGRAFIWQSGRTTELGEGDPLAINSRGEIIGRSGNRAILWRKKR
jgi:probable HAF family extracellular repeat protein